jgi:hypothetical protein
MLVVRVCRLLTLIVFGMVGSFRSVPSFKVWDIKDIDPHGEL